MLTGIISGSRHYWWLLLYPLCLCAYIILITRIKHIAVTILEMKAFSDNSVIFRSEATSPCTNSGTPHLEPRARSSSPLGVDLSKLWHLFLVWATEEPGCIFAVFVHLFVYREVFLFSGYPISILSFLLIIENQFSSEETISPPHTQSTCFG